VNPNDILGSTEIIFSQSTITTTLFKFGNDNQIEMQDNTTLAISIANGGVTLGNPAPPIQAASFGVTIKASLIGNSS